MPVAPVIIRATWDDDAHVWSISSDDVPGLNIEAGQFADIERKSSVAIEDLGEFEPDIAALAGRPLVVVTD